MSTSKNNRVITNFLWRFFERCGVQLVALVVQIVLARKLGRGPYGIIAIITIFTTIMQVFVDSGLGNALIQKKDSDDIDFSTVFYFNIIVGLVMYGIMFFSSPFIAEFYKMPELTLLLRVQSLMLIVASVRNVQQAYVSRNMLFKRFFIATIGGTVGAAILGVVMAYCGFGVWALIAQSLFNITVSTLLLWVIVKWRPKKVFSLERLKTLFSFGWKLLVSALVDTLYNDLRKIIIGKKYSSDDLALYDQGKKYPYFIVSNINTAIDSVLLPTMSNAQSDSSAVRGMTRRAIKMGTYIMMPLMIGFAVCSKDVVNLLLGAEWLPCVPFLRIFCITYAFYPIHTSNLNAIKAMGRSDLFLILEIIKKCVGLVLLLLTMFHSVMAMAYSLLLSTLLSSIINAFPNKKLLGYSYLEQLKDMLPQIFLSIGMGAVVYLVSFLGLPSVLTLCIQIPLGVLLYLLGSMLFRVESFTYIISVVKSMLGKK